MKTTYTDTSISEHPYELTSDDILFVVHVSRSGIVETELKGEREPLLAKDQACLRASPPDKRDGWGTHHDEHDRVALIGIGTAEYQRLLSQPGIRQKAATRSRRA